VAAIVSDIRFDANEKVLVVGLGRSGVAACDVLRARGCEVLATDDKSAAELGAAVSEIEAAGARFIDAAQLETVLPGLTVSVLSPGIPLTSPLVRRIQEGRVPVFSEIEAAYRISRAPLVAVTGTKGKTSTTALIGHLFRQAGRTTHVGGNIGNALIRETFNAQAGDWVVAEVSSFQLEAIRSFRPKIATILNISPDHLDRYHSMDEYVEAKFRIFANQGPGDTFAGNLDDPYVGPLADGEFAARIPSQALWFGWSPRRLTTVYVRNERITWAPPTGDPRPIDIMPIDEIPVPGRHNVMNSMAAILVGLAAGIDPEQLRDGVRSFNGLPHRVQTIAELDGVRYVDDSKATNPAAVLAAIESARGPVVLIMGGRSKRTDFSVLRESAAKRVKALVLIGEAADEIEAALRGAAPAVERAGSMEEAVDRARSFAQAGDSVVLSPGCASFDMFRSAEDRGERFTRAVLERQPVG
jgi:UDP-N-acetylmuramoylalanine--D-glutamate ligase